MAVAPAARSLVPPRKVRVRPPGSDWLYAKVYAGGTSTISSSAGPSGELVREALVSGLADDWFFVRYRDERSHLRVRFRGEPQQAHR